MKKYFVKFILLYYWVHLSFSLFLLILLLSWTTTTNNNTTTTCTTYYYLLLLLLLLLQEHNSVQRETLFFPGRIYGPVSFSSAFSLIAITNKWMNPRAHLFYLDYLLYTTTTSHSPFYIFFFFYLFSFATHDCFPNLTLSNFFSFSFSLFSLFLSSLLFFLIFYQLEYTIICITPCERALTN